MRWRRPGMMFIVIGLVFECANVVVGGDLGKLWLSNKNHCQIRE